MTMIPARAPYSPPTLGEQYNRTEVREALTRLALSVSPMVTRTVVAATTIRADDDLIVCDAIGGAFSVTLLPAAQVQFLRLTIKRINSGANAVTVSGTVDATVNPSLGSQWSSITIQSDGIRWLKLAAV